MPLEHKEENEPRIYTIDVDREADHSIGRIEFSKPTIREDSHRTAIIRG